MVSNICVNGAEIAREITTKLGKFMRQPKCVIVFMAAAQKVMKPQWLRRIPSSGIGHNVEYGPSTVSIVTSILNTNLFVALQSEASTLTLKLPRDPKNIWNNTVKLLEVTEKASRRGMFWREETAKTLEAVQSVKDGPAGRYANNGNDDSRSPTWKSE